MAPKITKGEYIETDTGNKVSRRSQIQGTTNIILGGKTVIQAEVVVRGDLVRTMAFSDTSLGTPGQNGAPNVAVAMGRYCFMSKGCCLRPPGKIHRSAFSHYPLKMGDHVYVGPGSVVEAAFVGSHVHIGANVVVGKFCLIRDFVKILDDTIVPPNLVVPSYSVVAGRPGRVVGEIPEGGHEAFDCRELYKSIS